MAHYEDYRLKQLVDSINRAETAPLLIGIDGQGGSGKSTLARELAQNLERSTTVVEGDDFYSDIPDDQRAALSAAEGFEYYFDWKRLRKAVLTPTKAGIERLCYQQYDWDSARLGDWVSVPVTDVIIVEGVYTLRPTLRDMWDITVFVNTDNDIRLERQLARGDSDEWLRRWMAAEDFYVAEHEPLLAADWVIQGLQR